MKNPHQLLPVGTPSISGRIYPEVECQKVIDQINNEEVVVIVDFPETMAIPVDRIAGRAKNARIEDGWVVFDYHGRKTPMGAVLKTLMDAEVNLDFRTMGIGYVSNDWVVSDYEFIAVVAVARGADRIKEPRA